MNSTQRTRLPLSVMLQEPRRCHEPPSNFLYGPCHGTGIIEVEKPWMETSSDFPLQENITFMADTFVTTPEFALRCEDNFRVTKDGVEPFSGSWQKIIEL